MWEILRFCREAAGVAAARRRAARELEALGERHLADIGLDRAEIPASVRSGWPWPRLWPPSPVERGARLRVSLRGCG